MSHIEPPEENAQSAGTSNPFQRYQELAQVPLEGALAEDWDQLAQPGSPG